MRKILLLCGFAVLGLVAGGVAHAKGKAKKKADPPVAAPAAPDPAALYDASAIKGKLIVTADGKGHYLVSAASLADEDLRGLFFYSDDGKTFYQQRVPSYGGSGDTEFSMTFWEPRVQDGWKRSYDRKGDAYSIQCDDRNTPFKLMPAADAKKLLDAATFMKPRWKYMAYALARDDSGRYFYVDCPREPEDSKAFRLFMGQKNALKPLKMTNVVSDSQGDIFATKTGELRLIIPKEGGGGGLEASHRDPMWIKGKSKTALTWVPVEDNTYLIYVELGVYTGMPLGTPCDDL